MTFDELLKAERVNPTAVIFYGTNCMPCERLKPKLKRVCGRINLSLEQLNSAAELPAIRALGLRSVPAVVVVYDGKAIFAFSGDLPEHEIGAKLAAVGVNVW